MKKQPILQLAIALGLFGICFSYPPSFTDSIENTQKEKDTSSLKDNDTIWNVVVYVEFGVDTNGHIHDVAAENQFECVRCDSTLINELKKEAVETVQAMPRWDNYQHKDIRYEIPVRMVKTHPNNTHKTHHHKDSIRVDIN